MSIYTYTHPISLDLHHRLATGRQRTSLCPGLVVEIHGFTAAAGTGHGHWLRSLGEGTGEVTGTVTTSVSSLECWYTRVE